MSDSIRGYCPMGCGRMLFLREDGRITCTHTNCPRPRAVAELLADRETEHIVQLGAKEFTVRHPLRERLDDALMHCALPAYISLLAAPPAKPGRYRARKRLNGGWTWEPLPDEATAVGTAAVEHG